MVIMSDWISGAFSHPALSTRDSEQVIKNCPLLLFWHLNQPGDGVIKPNLMRHFIAGKALRGPRLLCKAYGSRLLVRCQYELASSHCVTVYLCHEAVTEDSCRCYWEAV